MMDLSKGVPGARKHGDGATRRALMLRAAVVAGILLLMLLALLLTAEDEQAGLAPEASQPVQAPLPKLGAQLPEPAPAGTSTTPALPSVTAQEAAVSPTATVGSGGVANQVQPPAPVTSAGTPPAGLAPQREAMVASATPASVPARPVAPPAATVTAPGASNGAAVRADPAKVDPVAATGGIRVHLGDFGRVDRAVRLVEALTSEGMPAAVQRRVVIGPYSGRKAAVAAAERLGKAVSIDGMVVPARTNGQFLVQAGVFSESRNAEALRARLAAAKFKALVQGRAVLGPFATRDGAEKALAKVSGKRNIAGTIVSTER